MSLRVLYHHRIRADDGQAVHVRELVEAMRRRGHEVQECALVQKAVAKGPGAPRKPSFWQRLQLPRTAVEVMEVAYNRRARSMLRAAVRSFRPDVLYERHALHCRAGLEIAREAGLPMLLEVNSPMVDEMEKLGMLRLKERARATERFVLGGADRVLAVTQVLADRLVELGARRDHVVVIGNGAQPERYDTAAHAAAQVLRQRWGLPSTAVVLGFVGFMRPWHRLDLVLRAMAAPGFEQAHLVMVGDGPALPGLVEEAAARGLSSRVHALGEVPSDLVPAHVCAFDVALIPAINDYASPLKLFDSLAAGVATLAPDQPNLREVVRDGQHAVLYRPGDEQDFTTRLRLLVQDGRFRERIGTAGEFLLRERELTWDGNARRVTELAEELLRRRRR